MSKSILAMSTRFLKKNSSTILTCLGAIGVVGTAVVAVNATPKAIQLLEKAKEEKGEKLTVLETVKAAGPAYIPAAVIGVSTIACVVGSNTLNKKAQASIASAYALVDKSYNLYRNKVKEMYGDDTDLKIRDAIMKDTVLRKEPNIGIQGVCTDFVDELDYFADKGDVTFYDEYSNRYFVATAYDVRDAEYHLNRNFSLSGFCDLNEFYDFLGIDREPYGDSVGWTMEYGYTSIDIYHRKVVLEDGMEICVIEYVFEPDAGYENPDCNYFNE